MKPLITFLMTTYRKMEIFSMAVASLQNQSFQNWELLILDNASTEDSWNIVTQVTDKDARIEAFRNEENVGWAKGTSLLLPKAKGEYVTFLAADDFINDETLGDLAVKLEKEKPDIAFVGNAFLEVKDDLSIRVLGGNCPKYCLYGPENRSECIVEILKTVYFNSMFLGFYQISIYRKNVYLFFELQL
jgi:glycosyltransferase involved in cell wall biosynthesis